MCADAWEGALSEGTTGHIDNRALRQLGRAHLPPRSDLPPASDSRSTVLLPAVGGPGDP
jgi:hypothetical protein